MSKFFKLSILGLLFFVLFPSTSFAMLNIQEEELFYVNTPNGTSTTLLIPDGYTITNISIITDGYNVRLYCYDSLPIPSGVESVFYNYKQNFNTETLFYCKDNIYVKTQNKAWVGVIAIKGNYATTTSVYTSLINNNNTSSVLGFSTIIFALGVLFVPWLFGSVKTRRDKKYYD